MIANDQFSKILSTQAKGVPKKPLKITYANQSDKDSRIHGIN